MARLGVGDRAPGFELPGSDGKVHRLADHVGVRPVVVAWFPKARTPGWTMECKSLRESGDRIREFDVAYFAASIDAPETNEKFAESLELDYPILSDPDKEVARAYGVLRGFGLYAARHTVYIDKDGKVALVDTDVKPKTAGDDLVARMEQLGFPRK